MLTEAEALLLPCPILNGEVKVIDGYNCDGSKCTLWRWSRLGDLCRTRRGDCCFLERKRKRDREREEE